MSADGAMISLVHKQWVETRTVAIGEPQETRNPQGETEIHVGDLSYFSRLANAVMFTTLAEVEMRRRNVKGATQVCAVMDGADWLQVFTDRHRPDALRILDFPHAAEHTTKLLEALEKAGRRFPPQMQERCLYVLKHRGPRPLVRMADRLGNDLALQKEINAHLDSLCKRESLMQYPEFRQIGWPIGSGMIESANKNIVEAPSKEWGCIGNAKMLILCSPYAMPSAMIVGRRCGKRRSGNISANKPFKGQGQCKRRLGYTRSSLLKIPPLSNSLLNRLLHPSLSLLLLLAFCHTKFCSSSV